MKLEHFYSEDMALALILWFCTLPLIGLFVVPFFGWKAGLTAAVFLFLISLLYCWGICGWKLIKKAGHG